MSSRICLRKTGDLVPEVSLMRGENLHGNPVIKIYGIEIQINLRSIEVRNSHHYGENEKFKTIFIPWEVWNCFIKQIKNNGVCSIKNRKGDACCVSDGIESYVEVTETQCKIFCELVKVGGFDDLIKITS